MKKIRLKFVDFWDGFDDDNNRFINALRKKYEVIICDSPDYIIAGSFGYSFLEYKCIRINIATECIRPDFNVFDYALGHDCFQCEDRFLRFPPYAFNINDMDLAIKKTNISETDLTKKTKFCNFIYSNKDTAIPERLDFLNLLCSKYKNVESGGRLNNNIGYYVENKLEFQQYFKFSIAFENNNLDHATTEKLIQAWGAKTVPIYYGCKSVGTEFNTKAFINCHDYRSFDEVIERIKEIDNNETLFKQMLKEPIFNEDTQGQKFMTDEYLLLFFENIFNQDLSEASRRNIYGYNKIYENRLMDFNKYNLNPIIRAVKRLKRLKRKIMKK